MAFDEPPVNSGRGRRDPATAERLASALAAEADPERLAAVGEEVVRCQTGDELLRRAGASTH